MRLATIMAADGPAWGIEGDDLLDLREAFPTLRAAIAAGALGTLAGRDGPRMFQNPSAPRRAPPYAMAPGQIQQEVWRRSRRAVYERAASSKLAD